jgi:GxxExxY protein
MLHEKLTEQIIGAAIEVHRHLGAGLLESTYRAALAHEFNLRGIGFRKEVELPVQYKGIKLGDEKYRINFIVEEKVIVEAKAVIQMHSIFQAQTLTYMQHTKIEVGLLINFNVEKLVDGVQRLIKTFDR